jgi:hypothetical protein
VTPATCGGEDPCYLRESARLSLVTEQVDGAQALRAFEVAARLLLGQTYRFAHTR